MRLWSLTSNSSIAFCVPYELCGVSAVPPADLGRQRAAIRGVDRGPRKDGPDRLGKTFEPVDDRDQNGVDAAVAIARRTRTMTWPVACVFQRTSTEATVASSPAVCLLHCRLRERRAPGFPEPARGAAYYFSVSLILDPARNDLLPLLDRVAPDIDLTSLQAAQDGTRCETAGQTAIGLGRAMLDANNPGAAASFFATAIALAPGNWAARARLLELAPDISLDVLPAARDAASPTGAAGSPRKAPAPGRLRELVNAGRHEEAASLLDGADLAAERNADIFYHAGICFASVGREREAIDLLKRAASAGFSGFWCAYHLGLFEEKVGRTVQAAYYYSAALMLDPARTDILAFLDRVAPDLDLTSLQAAQRRAPSAAEADLAFGRGDSNPYFQNARFRWMLPEPGDYAAEIERVRLSLGCPEDWRQLLNPGGTFLGGVCGMPGAGGLLLVYRWFLRNSIILDGLLGEYDRFVITRSDFIFVAPHPCLDALDPRFIWLPNGEDWGGLVDRHAVLNKHDLAASLATLSDLRRG